jgi:hypothetical protein
MTFVPVGEGVAGPEHAQAVDLAGLAAFLRDHPLRDAVADHLDVETVGQLREPGDVRLLEGVLQRDDRIARDEFLVEGQQVGPLYLLAGQVVAVGHGVVEVRRGDVGREGERVPVAQFLDGRPQALEGLARVVHPDGVVPALVADVARGHTVLPLDDVPEFVVDLGTHADGLGEGVGPDRPRRSGATRSSIAATAVLTPRPR